MRTGSPWCGERAPGLAGTEAEPERLQEHTCCRSAMKPVWWPTDRRQPSTESKLPSTHGTKEVKGPRLLLERHKEPRREGRTPLYCRGGQRVRKRWEPSNLAHVHQPEPVSQSRTKQAYRQRRPGARAATAQGSETPSKQKGHRAFPPALWLRITPHPISTPLLALLGGKVSEGGAWGAQCRSSEPAARPPSGLSRPRPAQVEGTAHRSALQPGRNKGL